VILALIKRTGLSPVGKVACLQPAHLCSIPASSRGVHFFSLNELAVALPLASMPKNSFLYWH
jgi:hypothetical protein